jgi:hypothetical protein
MTRRIRLTDRPAASEPNPDREIPYLLCKECGTPCYVFETDKGRVTEALCIACGNEAVSMFIVGDWEEDEG